MNQTASTPRGRFYILAMALLGAFAPTAFFGLPQLVGASAQYWQFTDSQLGIAVFIEIGGNAIGALTTAFLISQWQVRRLLILGIVLCLSSNLLTTGIHGIETYSATRLFAGIASGMLSSIAMRYLSFTDNPDRDFGYMVVAQALWSMLLLGWLLPYAGEHWQAAGCYTLVAFTTLPFLLVLPSFAANEPFAPPQTEGGSVNRMGAYITLLSLFMMYIGVGVMWTFVDQIGQRSGLSADFISSVLAGANLVTVVPCLLLPRLMVAGGTYRWCLLMLSGCAVGAGMLALPMTPFIFVAAVVLFVASWNCAAMLIFATVPQFDGVGRHTALSPGFLGVGYGVGSVAAGELLERGLLGNAIALSSLACVLAIILYSTLRAQPAVSQTS